MLTKSRRVSGAANINSPNPSYRPVSSVRSVRTLEPAGKSSSIYISITSRNVANAFTVIFIQKTSGHPVRALKNRSRCSRESSRSEAGRPHPATRPRAAAGFFRSSPVPVRYLISSVASIQPITPQVTPMITFFPSSAQSERCSEDRG